MRILLWLTAACLPVAAAAATLQEEYSAAQAAYDAGRMSEARAGFAAILPRLDANASRSWLLAQGSTATPPVAEAVALPWWRNELSRRTAIDGAESPRLMPALMAIGINRITAAAEGYSVMTQARRIGEAAGAPRDLVIAIRLRQTVFEVADEFAKRSRSDPTRETTRRLQLLLADLDREGAGQSYGAALVASNISLWAYDDAAMAAAYRRVLATPLAALADGARLRQTARLALASIEATASRIDAARQLLADTGLTAEQCSAIPVEPKLLSGALKATDFPEEAMKWGFEGMVRVAYDIDTNGRPLAPRAVVAHPPLIFSDSTEKLAKGFRYQPQFRDGVGVGCADMQQTVRYRINVIPN